MFVLPAISPAAKLWAPPVVSLADGANKIVVARALSAAETGRATFRTASDLYGEGDSEVALRVQDDGYAPVREGVTYILAYSYVRKHPQFRDEYIEDPQGPRVLDVSALDMMALFEDRPELRFLFKHARADAGKVGRRQLDAVLALLRDAEPRSRRLAAFELMLREDLKARITDKDARVVAAVLGEEDLEPQFHNFVLTAAQGFPESQRGDWLADAERAVLAAAKIRFNLASHEPALVLTALRGLKTSGTRSDVPAIARFFTSNSPPVVKAAIESADALDASAALALANQAALPRDAHPDIQRALAAYTSGARQGK
jgi:hypothetical protein